LSTTSPPTRSQGFTVRSKATGDRPSPFLPFHLDVRGARGFRVARHPIARILTAKGCRMRRSGGKEARERRDDRHAPEPGRPTGGKSPLGQASEKRNFLYSGVRPIRLRPRVQGRGVTRGTGAGPGGSIPGRPAGRSRRKGTSGSRRSSRQRRTEPSCRPWFPPRTSISVRSSGTPCTSPRPGRSPPRRTA